MPMITRDRVLEAYNSGMRMPDVCRFLDITNSTVRYHLIKMGVEIRDRWWQIQGKHRWVRLSMVGSQKMMIGFSEFLYSFGCVEKLPRVAPKGGSFTVKFGARKDVQAITEVLYSDALVYLDRKYALYQEMFT
jgi:hypothetical protein